MKLLTEDAKLICKHVNGRVHIRATQNLVTIEQRRVLVDDDPEKRPISGCPNIGPTIKPCQLTLKVKRGYSSWISIEGRSICLDTVTGLTDGTPPGTVDYVVSNPGQWLVTEAAK